MIGTGGDDVHAFDALHLRPFPGGRPDLIWAIDHLLYIGEGYKPLQRACRGFPENEKAHTGPVFSCMGFSYEPI
jgi:hypothetical protein